MAGRGYIKLHRDSIDHAVFQDPWLWKLFCWCLLKANFRPSVFRGQPVPRGSFVTGRNAASDALLVSPSRVYRGFDRLVALGCLNVTPNNNWTTITVCNYETYNSREATTEQPENNEKTSGDTTSEQPANTIEETKNLRTLLVAEPRQAANGSGDGEATPKATKAPAGYPEAFEDFWKSYPPRGGRRRGKDACCALWRSLTEADRAAVLAAARQYAASDEAVRGFARDPERFFKKNWWREWVPSVAVIHHQPQPVAAPKEIKRKIEPVDWGDV